MATVRTLKEHLAGFHQKAQEHHTALAEHHLGLAGHFKKLAAHLGKAEFGKDVTETLEAISAGHEQAHVAHADFANFHGEKCEECEKAISVDDLNKLAPTSVSAVVPTHKNTLVPRAGQRDPGAGTVPAQFEKLLALPSEDEERSLQ